MSRLAVAFARQSRQDLFPDIRSNENVPLANGHESETDTTSVDTRPKRQALAAAALDDQQKDGVVLTPEELQMFDKENGQLFDDLNAITDEVK